MFNSATILNNRYQLQHQLGFGGFSQVWYAWDERGQYEVAVKIFLRQDEEGLRMCEEEFNRTNRLRHNRLIRLLDINVHEEAPYLVMPYYHRKTLENSIGEVDEATLWRIMLHIGSALDHIHGLNPPMVHNDLKPDNFLIDDDGGYVLTDFGISSELAEKMTRSRDFAGISTDDDMDPKRRPAGVAPRAYRAPELFHYRDVLKNKAVKSSDIWAFGACIYELAIGETPFGEQGGLYQLMQHKDYGKLVPELVAEPFPRHFSPQLSDTVYRCLSFLTWDRPVARHLVETAEHNLARLEGRPAPERYQPGPTPPPPPQPETWQQPVSPHRPYVPEYQAPAPIKRQSLRTVRERDTPVWVWIIGLVALAGVVFWGLSQAFGTTHVVQTEPAKNTGAISVNAGEKSSDAATSTAKPNPPVIRQDTATVKPGNTVRTKTKKPVVNNEPPAHSVENPVSPPPVGPLQTIGSPSPPPGYHFVIMGNFGRQEAKKNVGILQEAFPEKNIWATETSWGHFEIKLGSFPTRTDASTFHVKLSQQLEQVTSLGIRPN